MYCRNKFYDLGLLRTSRVAVPVISVGNLTAGGTGKTPFVEYLIRHFSERQKNVAVLSRGYRRISSGTVVVQAGSNDRGNAALLGDEPYQVARKFPDVTVVVDAKRVRGAQAAIQGQCPDVILLDDGFQHRALARDINIVMIDGQSELRSMRMLPAGLRRESLRSLARADVIVVSRPARTLNRLNEFPLRAVRISAEPVPVRFHDIGGQEAIGLDSVRGKTCVAFSAIANAASFKKTLEALGLTLIHTFEVPDHHNFSSNDLEAVGSAIEKMNPSLVVTTEKDAARLRNRPDLVLFSGKHLIYLEVKFVITEGEDALRKLLDGLVCKN